MRGKAGKVGALGDWKQSRALEEPGTAMGRDGSMR